jgi:hypothetical protein
MAAMASTAGQRLQIAGERTSGQDVRSQNVTAVTAVANIVKSSLGPVGLDKVRPAVPGGPAPRLRPAPQVASVLLHALPAADARG